MASTLYSVTGMTCSHCSAAVTREVSGVVGVESVEVTVETGAVVVDGDHVDHDEVRAAIDLAGYEVR